AVVSLIALLMTAGIYIMVAGIVKLDDLGLHLVRASREAGEEGFKEWAGKFILWLAPY
ncbi:MAG: DUF808 domain-containing protein, partial [Desulfuromonadales bacterium]|nr:DUF808 domain-containing protein [Desulfuromonadales bacterium]NIS39891.1 DUF808 domain-containing protein [Desulfuromonadales bacterium]